jgi:hypothetical protein
MPRSIAAQAPPAKTTVPRALAEVAAAANKKNSLALIATNLTTTDKLHHWPQNIRNDELTIQPCCLMTVMQFLAALGCF